MNLQIPSEIQKGQPILASWLNQLVRNLCAQQLQSSPDHIIRTSSGGTTIENVREPGAARIRYGTAAADYSSGTTISLTPCDANGVAISSSAVTVTIPTSWGTVDLLSAVVGGATTAVTCKIASGTLLQYASAADGTAYLLGLPPMQVLWDYQYDTSSHKFQVKLAYIFGTNVSTVSAWLDVRACTQVTAITAWQVDLTSGEVQKKTQAFYAPEVGSESAWMKIEDTEESKAIECTPPGS
jgi:hypothetical protein